MADFTFTAEAPADVNVPVLITALQTALGDKPLGLGIDGRTVTVTVQAEPDEIKPGSIEAIIENHDPTQLTDQQQAEQRRLGLREAVASAPLQAIINQTAAATNVDELKAALLATQLMMAKMVIAAGYTDQAEPTIGG